MKKFGIGIVALLVVIIGAISAFWWMHTDHLKHHIVSVIDHLNTVKSGSHTTTIHYQEISSSGYPMHSSVKIKNPKVIFTNTENSQTEEIAFLGDVVIAKDVFSTSDKTKAWIEANGKIQFPKDETGLAYSLSGKYVIGCDCAENFILFDEKMNPNMNETELNKHMMAWIPELPYGFHAQVKDLCLCNEQNVGLVKLDHASFKLNKKHPHENESKFDYDLKIKRFDVLVKEFYSLGSSEVQVDQHNSEVLAPSNKKQNALTPQQLSAYQSMVNLFPNPITSDLVLKGNVTVPRGMSQFLSGHTEQDLASFLDVLIVKVDEYKFSNKSDLWSLNDNGMTDLVFKDNQPFKLIHNDTLTVQFDKKINQFFTSYAQAEYNNSGDPTTDGVIAGITGSLPDLSQFGKISYTVDYDLHTLHPIFFPKMGSEELPSYDSKFKIKKIALTSDLYGAILKGDLDLLMNKTTDNTLILNGELSLTLTNEQALMRDAANYYKQLQALVATLDNTQARMLPDFPFDLLRNTLKALSNDPNSNSKDITSTIILQNNVPTKIGTKNWLQLMPTVKPLMDYFQSLQMPAGDTHVEEDSEDAEENDVEEDSEDADDDSDEDELPVPDKQLAAPKKSKM